MKVTVTVTVEVDPEAWDIEYGTGTAVADVRRDVKAYIGNGINDFAASTSGALTVTNWK